MSTAKQRKIFYFFFSKNTKVKKLIPDNKINGDELRVGKTSRHLICLYSFLFTYMKTGKRVRFSSLFFVFKELISLLF